MLDFCPNKNDKNFQEEFWVPITFDILNGIEPGYYISNWGRIYNSNTFTIFPGETVNRKWYVGAYFDMLTGERIHVPLHRLVAYVFIPKEHWELFEVNHKDGVKYHNWIWNLEWVTHKENMHHANCTGLCKIGEQHGNSVVTNEQVENICSLISKGYSPNEIHCLLSNEMEGIDIGSIVDSIKNGYAWKHIANKYDFSNIYHRELKFTEEEIHKICTVFQNYGKDISYKRVLDLIGYNYQGLSNKELQTLNVCIFNLRHRKYFKNITSMYVY